MKTRTHGLDEKEMELVKLLMAECKSTGDIQAKLKKLSEEQKKIVLGWKKKVSGKFIVERQSLNKEPCKCQ